MAAAAPNLETQTSAAELADLQAKLVAGGLTAEEQKRFGELLAERNGARVENISAGSAANDSLHVSEKQQREFPAWMSAELAALHGNPTGRDILRVVGTNFEIGTAISNTRDRVTQVLAINNQEDVINRLVSEELRARLEELGQKIAEANGKADNTFVLNKTKTNLVENANSRANLEARILELQDAQNGFDAYLPGSAEAHDVELEGLTAIRDIWDETERNVRAKLILARDTETEFLDRHFGNLFAPNETDVAGQNTALEAWMNENPPLSANQQDILRDLQNQHQLQNFLRAPVDFEAWVQSQPNAQDLRDIYLARQGQFDTQRNLVSLVKDSEIRDWRGQLDGKLLMAFLSSEENHVFLNGGVTQPHNSPNPIQVVGVYQEMSGNKAATLQRNLDSVNGTIQNLEARLLAQPQVPVGPGLSFEQNHDRLRAILETNEQALKNLVDNKEHTLQQDPAVVAAERALAQAKNRLEIVRERQAAKLQQEWEKLNAQSQRSEQARQQAETQVTAWRTAAGTRNLNKQELDASAIASKNLDAASDRALNDQNQLGEQQDKMLSYFSDTFGFDLPGNNFQGFTTEVNTALNGLPGGAPTADIAARAVQTAEAALTAAKSAAERTFAASEKAAQDAVNTAKGEFEAVDKVYQEIHAPLEKARARHRELTAELATVDASPERPRAKLSLREMHVQVRAKQREVEMCAARGLTSTADLTAEERAECLAEARAFTGWQHELAANDANRAAIQNKLRTRSKTRPPGFWQHTKYFFGKTKPFRDAAKQDAKQTWSDVKGAPSRAVNAVKATGGFFSRVIRSA